MEFFISLYRSESKRSKMVIMRAVPEARAKFIRYEGDFFLYFGLAFSITKILGRG